MAQPVKEYDVFQAIADPTRREVLKLLAEKQRPISDISNHFEMTRTAVAKHLFILSEAGLIKGEKVGREKRYQLQPEPLADLQEWLTYFDQFWTNKLSVLKNLAEADGENSD